MPASIRFPSLVAFTLLGSFACDTSSPSPAPIDGDVRVACAVRGQRCGHASCCGVLECNAIHVCTDGLCFDKGAYCATSSDCCGVLECRDGICTDGFCSAEGVHCARNLDCCDGSCVKGNCTRAAACFLEGWSCTMDADCCGTLTCEDGGCFDWTCGGAC